MLTKELAKGQLYQMQERHQTTRGGQMQEKHQTTREGPEKYADTKPSVIKKELAEGQLDQMQEKH